MSKKIIDIRTITTTGEGGLTAQEHFDIQSSALIKEGFQPYESVKVDQTEIYTSRVISTTTLGGYTRITQQFAKYEEEIDLVSTLRDCVSETWGAKSFGEAQKLFDKFLETRNIKP